ncbi:hypothetical protein G6L16_023455 [Agrobacterium tumefaciens]|uniref:hypothetical protein n=1 Tax=Agrobacterium tumefaciens TaxID=358 RepID=UPI0015722FD4|nr:hypothetical protein [Agrobacterium tumefaciens]NSZ66986.1 hypothetical protein [Agrobacterium tumefaciens]NTA73343.1 hypothetical protein [Agrobacterium tumefaciens]WIE41149.1 hypothetical protein G6L16_023455 [Agrobacterium tumefaciens]
MKTLIFYLALFLSPITTALANCPAPVDSSFSAAAKAKFDCSSSLPLKGHETDRKFQIHYDFPKTLPDTSKLSWLTIDPFKNPSNYMHSILNYVTKVNARPEIDWRIEDNKEEQWCDAPWFFMLREPLHGMTTERWSRPKELHALQTEWERTFAVGIYNDVACYGFGQIWADPASPKTRDFAFADGAVSAKMLFTSATPSSVPYLAGSKEWDVAGKKGGDTMTMRLLQLDISVKDERSPNGWFFGTFVYNAMQPGNTPYERLVPVGLIWGSDPALNVEAYLSKAMTPTESWVNPDVAAQFYALPRQHLGLFGRANGPVDNPLSACITCHQRAHDWGTAVLPDTWQAAEADKLLPDVPSDPYDNKAVAAYFRNIGTNSPVAETQSLDYVLQVSKGIAAFRNWVATDFPQYTSSTTDVPPYPFKRSPPEACPCAATDDDTANIATPVTGVSEENELDPTGKLFLR